MKMKSKTLIWDWPIRIFHLLFALMVLGALGFSFLGEHTSYFQWHMLFGICAGFLLLMRFVLGLIGSKPYHVSELASSFKQLPEYLRGYFGKDLQSYAGHNPLAWLVYLMMFVSLFMTVFTGINMRYDWAEDIHSVFAWLTLICIALHLVGIAVHSFRFKEAVALSMVHGRKQVEAEVNSVKSKPLLGAFILVIFGVFGIQLLANYQPGSEQIQLPWIGTTIYLEEGEGESSEYENDHHRDRKHKDDEEHEEHEHHGRHGDD